MIDKAGQKIIQELQRDGRESYSSLAKSLGIVEGTVRKRIKRLMQEDILKIVAVPNVRKLGYGFMAIMGIQVRMENLRTLMDNLVRNKHVCYLVWITGKWDLMAIVVARSSEEFSQFVEKELSVIPGVLRTETFVNLDTVKGAWGLLDTKQLISDLDISSLRKL